MVCHPFVALEDMPADIVRGRGKDNPTGLAYNKMASEKDDLLATCFAPSYNDAHHMLLAHCHMLLSLRTFLTRPTWDLPVDLDRDITYCDA